MQVWMCIRDFLVVKKRRIKTNEKEIREFFYGLKNVKVAIEASIAEAKIKSDKIDAKILADLTRNLLPTSWIPPKEIRELRDLVRQRIFLVKQKTKMDIGRMCKNSCEEMQ
ncbi:MAG: hypothetical protein DRN11_03265 [Thermoplasmata archaeon]|nr:MAG: hypothetical protein DRN11_03265 [Thermoplasmata archaeon]